MLTLQRLPRMIVPFPVETLSLNARKIDPM